MIPNKVHDPCSRLGELNRVDKKYYYLKLFFLNDNISKMSSFIFSQMRLWKKQMLHKDLLS
jgi:hypothetical protein